MSAERERFIQIRLEPGLPDAVVTLTREGEREPMETSTTDATGSVAWNLEFGTYFYGIKAPNYVEASGRVKLATSDSTYVEKVKLTPNFGYLEIQDPGNASGAKVFAGDKEVGSVPYKSDVKWDCGTYRLLLVKELYKSHTEEFAIKQGETTVVRPVPESNLDNSLTLGRHRASPVRALLIANFAETTLTVEGGADIYIDGTRKGTGRWAGPLKAGTYLDNSLTLGRPGASSVCARSLANLVECRKANHRKTQKEIHVEADVAATFALDPPIPVTGFLSVNSTPVGARIKIDGKDFGQTPKIIQDLLVGQHRVEVSMAKRKPEVREVNIMEGKEEQLNVELSSTALVSFTGTPNGASVLIDGKPAGQIPFTNEMASGNYDIQVMANGHSTFHRKMYIDVAKPAVHVKLSRQLTERSAFYFGADGQFGASTAAGGTMGFYAGGVNVEAFYMKGFGKETVFWNSTGENEQAAPWTEEELKRKSVAGGKTGFGFIVGTRFRMTPQVGCSYLGVKGNNGTSLYALSGTAGLRLEVACTSCLGISLTPEYAFKLAEADGYERLSSAIPAMKDWSEGFNCKVGVYCFF